MPLVVSDLKLPLHADESSLKQIAARALAMPADAVRALRVNRVSLDARKKNDIQFIYTVTVELSAKDEAFALRRGDSHVARAEEAPVREPVFGEEPLHAPIAVVGFGPAGIFAAYTLARCGYRPLVLERGRAVETRKADVERFWQTGQLDPISNAVFGEGGAGTFSDGKLTTRIKDPRAREVVSTLADFGAPEEIRVMAKPHIGTDKLTETIANLRAEILRLGGEVRFETRLVGLEAEAGQLTALIAESGTGRERIPCAACILAAGHGADDTYHMLHAAGVKLHAKPFAAGVRIEHPRELIDRAQYGSFAGHPRLGAAEYHLAGQAGGRGVYTFCMCPGGVVAACASGEGQVVTNGMSYYARDGANSNAAIVVQVDERDFGADPLAALRFRAEMEHAAFRLGGGDFTAPASRVGEFLRGEASRPFGAVQPTYRPGVRASDVAQCLPDFIAAGIRAGIADFGRKLRGFDMADAVITAVESRTSAPIRIERDVLGQAPDFAGLYPAGEGAGYAGGIVSAAVDGMRAAERVMERFARP